MHSVFCQTSLRAGRSRAVLHALFFCIVVMTCSVGRGQTVDDFGAWFSLNTQGKWNPNDEQSKLRWWFDGHLRYLDDADGFNQSIFRPGIGYQLTPNTNVWLGYAWINELPANGNPVFDENRIWQQALWSKKVGRQKLFSRSRLEQRFVETGDDTGWRFRQFFKMDRPLYEESASSFVVWDEAFLDLNETDWGQQGSFSQNRLFVGFGRKFNGGQGPKIEIGYLNQFLRRKSGGGDRFNHILSVNWFFTF
ncbi:MAG: DUF2490 domain-containing protein [Mariniblastus sp.]